MDIRDLPPRFRKKIVIDPITKCWLWNGSIHPNGYGRVEWCGKTEKAHRVVQLIAGVILKEGMVTDHICRVRRCVNPDHMEQVTAIENTHRGKLARKTCFRGHPFSGANLRITKFNGYNMRVCRQCNADNARKWRERKVGVPS